MVEQSGLHSSSALRHCFGNAFNPTGVALDSVQVTIELLCNVLEIVVLLSMLAFEKFKIRVNMNLRYVRMAKHSEERLPGQEGLLSYRR